MAELERVSSRLDTDNYETHGVYSTENYLQTYQVFITPPEITASVPLTKYWVIFIHGGAWRDPTVGASSFVPACKQLLGSPIYTRTASQIEGYASLDYRLSAHYEYPQDPSKVESYWMRNARHPEHLIDVTTAIGALQQKYKFGNRYILVGHSCGATMALQSVMRLEETESRRLSWTPPRAILGVHGIYDIPLLLETFRDIPDYRDSVTGAFGDEKRVWEHVSPARGDWLNKPGAWGAEGDSLLVIAHSPVDDVVDWPQAESMAQKVQSVWCRPVVSSEYHAPSVKDCQASTGTSPDRQGNFALVKLASAHNEVWETGWELARAIAIVVRGLNRLETCQVAFDDRIQTDDMKPSRLTYGRYSGVVSAAQDQAMHEHQ